MSIERTEMINSLKEIVIPELKNEGFSGSFPHYRRILPDKINLITFQFDRNGGGFVIEITNYNEKEFIDVKNEILPLNKLTAHHLFDRQRIQPFTFDESDTKNWFRYDNDDFFHKYDEVSKLVLNKIPTMEEYWNSGKINIEEKNVTDFVQIEDKVKVNKISFWKKIKNKFT